MFFCFTVIAYSFVFFSSVEVTMSNERLHMEIRQYLIYTFMLFYVCSTKIRSGVASFYVPRMYCKFSTVRVFTSRFLLTFTIIVLLLLLLLLYCMQLIIRLSRKRNFTKNITKCLTRWMPRQIHIFHSCLVDHRRSTFLRLIYMFARCVL